MTRSVIHLLFALSLIVPGVPAFSQTFGEIMGEVKGAAGASIPGATVTALNTESNATRTACTR